MKDFSRGWKFFLAVALVLGALLRLVALGDMEYKEDEQIDFAQSQVLLNHQALPAVGMPSGVYLANPGLSVWIFSFLGFVARARDPVSLQFALGLFSLLGISLTIPFALRFTKDRAERDAWLWAGALALVNPFQVFYQRKLWPEPFLPFFAV